MNKKNELIKQLNQLKPALPKKINVRELLIEHGVYEDYKQYIPEIETFLGYIYKEQKILKKYVEISRTNVIRKIFTYRKVEDEILMCLKDWGVIDKGNSYQVKNKCKGYKITDKYMDDSFYSSTSSIINISNNNSNFFISNWDYDYFFSSHSYIAKKEINYFIHSYPYKNNFINFPQFNLFISPNYFNLTPIMLGYFDVHPINTTISDYSNYDEKSLKKIIKKYKIVNSKISKESQNRFNELCLDPDKPQYNYIKQNIRKITIDVDAAIKYVDTLLANRALLRPEQIKITNKKGDKYPIWDKSRRMNKKIAKYWKDAIMKVHCGHDSISCPESTNRVYYSITGLPAELRRFLRIDGQPVFYGDISNCQPLLFVRFLLDEYGRTMPEDAKQYIQLVKNGEFYEYMMDVMDKPELKKRDDKNLTKDEKHEYQINRAFFKTTFFGKVFFDEGKINWKERKIFNYYFPSVARVVDKMKEGNYRNLSIKLQLLESSVIIDNVFWRLANSYEDECCLPVHDAIICSGKMVKTVKNIMEEEIYRVIDNLAKIKFVQL